MPLIVIEKLYVLKKLIKSFETFDPNWWYRKRNLYKIHCSVRIIFKNFPYYIGD